MRTNPPDPWVIVGRIGKAHGLDGSVRVWPEADLGEIFENLVPLKLWFPPKDPSQELILISARETSDAWVVLWEGIEDREATQSIRNGWIVSRREDLPETGEGVAYWDDLLGARVESMEGAPLGIVIEIHETPSNAVLEVEREDGGRFLIPLSEQVDADLVLATIKGEPNSVRVHLPEGMMEATMIDPSERPRKRDRRGKSRKGSPTSSEESRQTPPE